MADLLGGTQPRYPLVPGTTGAAASVAFQVSTSYPSVTLTANNLSEGESIPVQILDGDGVTWYNVTSTHPVTAVDTNVELTYGANTITLNGLGTYRLNKGVTTLAVSATLYR